MSGNEIKYAWFDDVIEKHITESSSVCDYGCGEEIPFYDALSSKNKKISRYLGIDNDPTAVERAEQKIGNNSEFITSDATCATPEGLSDGHYANKYDLVIMHYALHEIDPLEALPKIFKIIKPDGKILIGDVCDFVTFHGGQVPFDDKALKKLFNADYFYVDCKEHSYTVEGKSNKALSAVITLKPSVGWPDSHDLGVYVKDIYTEMLGKLKEERAAFDGNHDKDVPQRLRLLTEKEKNISDRLKKLDKTPAMIIAKRVDVLIEKIKQGRKQWHEKVHYTPQAGKHKKVNPSDFLEVSWQRKVDKLQQKDEDKARKEEIDKFRFSSLMEAIEDPANRRLVLLGNPGMGKTTTLEFLMYEYAERFKKERIIPILVKLKNYEGKKWLSKEISRQLEGFNKLPDYYELLFLLDGYNEVGKKTLSEELYKEITALLNNKYRIIITSRKHNYPPLDDCSTCEIEPLSDEKIKEFIGNFFAISNETEIEGYFKKIEDKKLLNISRIPLFLEFICELLRSKGELPGTKGELLGRMVNEKLRRHELKNLYYFKVPVSLINDYLLPRFCYTHYEKTDSIVFEEKDLREFIVKNIHSTRKAFPKHTNPQEIIEEIKKHGLLEGGHTLSFFHQTVFEYFTARHMAETIKTKYHENFYGYFIKHFRYKRWDEIISIFFDFISEERKKELIEYFAVDLECDDPARISLLIDVSMLSNTPESCIEILKHKSLYVRRSAADVLDEIKFRKPNQHLPNHSKDTKHHWLIFVSGAFGSIESEKAVEPLIELLKDNNPEVRRFAARTIGSIKSENAVEPLNELLKDKDADVVRAAEDALSKIKSEKAKIPISDSLKDNERLMFVTSPIAFTGALAEKSIESIIELLNHGEYEVRYLLAMALGSIKSKKTEKLLFELLKDSNSEVQLSAGRTLAQIIDAYPKTDDKLNLLNRVLEAYQADIRFYQSLKTIRHIP